MTKHPFYNDSLIALAVMEDTTPDILQSVLADPDTHESLTTKRKLTVLQNLCSAIHERGGDDKCRTADPAKCRVRPAVH